VATSIQAGSLCYFGRQQGSIGILPVGKRVAWRRQYRLEAYATSAYRHAELGKAGARNEAHIAGPDHGNPHSIDFPLKRRKIESRAPLRPQHSAQNGLRPLLRLSLTIASLARRYKPLLTARHAAPLCYIAALLSQLLSSGLIVAFNYPSQCILSRRVTPYRDEFGGAVLNTRASGRQAGSICRGVWRHQFYRVSC
jgi:hypothetical protein